MAAAAAAAPLAGLIQADAATNSLIITAPEPLYRNIRAIIDKLDVRRAQVVIESLIVEMTADKAAEFGIQWQALGNVNNSDVGVIGEPEFRRRRHQHHRRQPRTSVRSARASTSASSTARSTSPASAKSRTSRSWRARWKRPPTPTSCRPRRSRRSTTRKRSSWSARTSRSSPARTPLPAAPRQSASTRSRPSSAGTSACSCGCKPQISEGGVVRLAIYQELSSIQNTLTASQGGIITNKRSLRVDRAGRRRQHRRAGRPDRRPHRQQPQLAADPWSTSRGSAISSATRTAAARRPICWCSCAPTSCATKARHPSSRSTATPTSVARSPATRFPTTSSSRASRADSCRKRPKCRRRCSV